MAHPLCALVGAAALLAAAKPTSPAADKDFRDTLLMLRQEAGRSYLADRPLPDPTVLLAHMEKIPEQGRAAALADLEKISAAVDHGEYVRLGLGPEDDPELYRAMVRHAAGELAVSPELAESVYLKPDRKPSQPRTGSEAENAVRASLLAGILDAATRAPLSSELAGRIASQLEKSRSALMKNLPQDAATGGQFGDGAVVAAGAGGGGGQEQRAAVGPKGLKTSPAPPPLTPAGQQGFLSGLLDMDKAKRLVSEVKANVIGFTHHCYAYVKKALIEAGLVAKTSPLYSQELGASAYQFNKLVSANPALFKRKLLRIDARTRPLPIGSIIVWNPGTCGYHPKHGHIEITVSPTRACSDGCGSIRLDCMEREAGRGRVNVYVLERRQAPVSAANGSATPGTPKA